MILKNKHCIKCDICVSRKHIVNGVGNSNADLMIIGEAPGNKENRLGLPFVGNSGLKLSGYIDLMGFNREDVFITNTIRCRPPGNRVPTLIEQINCRPYLVAEILLIKPKIVLLLGLTALQNYFNNYHLRMSKHVGKVYFQNGLVIVVNYHPSYILYNKDAEERTLKVYELTSVLYKYLVNKQHKNKF